DLLLVHGPLVPLGLCGFGCATCLNFRVDSAFGLEAVRSFDGWSGFVVVSPRLSIDLARRKSCSVEQHLGLDQYRVCAFGRLGGSLLKVRRINRLHVERRRAGYYASAKTQGCERGHPLSKHDVSPVGEIKHEYAHVVPCTLLQPLAGNWLSDG